MSYAQWILLQIINRLQSGKLSVKNARLDWGKFYEWDDKNKDTTADAVNAVTVAPGETGLVASCGKSDAASGTEGYLDLYDGDTKICTVYWSVPWGSKYNTFTIQDRNPGYLISVSDWNQSHGGIGKVELEIAKKS
ncbi:Asp-hemolysin [Lasiodiplodia theobromae]|uniref:Asp-hemolysin n=1 Tax=Lasiodiplodia theobromae TaxID=45133 RepID=UPI0015C30066|nr:Asp-hemolysin [Lasiodiplodia theobromae]KAF4536456.1 Asp-hemolysin [Lasiodiplodia theobromae]